MLRILILVIMLPTCAIANAMPTDAQIQAVMQQTQATMQRMDAQPSIATPAMPKIKPSNTKQQQTPKQQAAFWAQIDKYAAQIAGKKPQTIQQGNNQLLIFVSLSMPKQSLKRLAKDAGLLGVPLLLRGLAEEDGKPSFKATAKIAAELELQKGQGFAIDPKLFEKYSINSVPAFVITNNNQQIAVAGDVSIIYALEYLARDHPDNITLASLLTRLQP
ncbi:MAG: type-F conjugative transfer system pilin assembly protein TrbC [Mariprofundales bacterium]